MIENKIQQKLSLILGSSGKTGKRVINRLISNGLNFREGSRNSEIPWKKRL